MTPPAEIEKEALVIGAGPAGLMAAETLSRGGARVLVCDAKPSPARKFLMAGKSGLNLTREEPPGAFLSAYPEGRESLRPALESFGAAEVQDWARGLGQDVFTGSTGRVFPVAMKASPLLRAWLARLDAGGVERRMRWRWTGWDGDAARFETPEGPRRVKARATILALGGASWARLGSDGAWADVLARDGAPLAPFAPSNIGLAVAWSAHMAPWIGAPLKGVALVAGAERSRGEAVVSSRGLEGGGIYALTAMLRQGRLLQLDLVPDIALDELTRRLTPPRGRMSRANHLRRVARVSGVKWALLNEFARPLPDAPDALARLLKALPVRHAGFRPMDEGISTAGGLRFDALDDDLMLRTRPGVFCAGEMLDWDAPTGGYLLTACLALGRRAGLGALARLGR